MIRPLFLFFCLALTGLSAFSQEVALLAENDSSFDTLAIQHRGRIKPFLSFAQEIATSICGRSTVAIPQKGKIGCRQLTLSILMNPKGWENQPILLVDDPSLRRELNLPENSRLFSPRQLSNLQKLAELTRQAELSRASGTRGETLPLAAAAQNVSLRIRLFASLVSGDAFRVIPPPSGSSVDAPWASPRVPFSLDQLLEQQKSGIFSRPKIQLEVAYLKFHPFRWAWVSWLLAAIFLLIAGQDSKHRLLPWGRNLAYLGLLLLLAGLAARIWIAGRPPVTNMYESILWVAFGAALFAVIFSNRHRSTIYLLAASPVVILALVGSDLQPAVLDPSLNPLVPVLRSNFWLTIHVLTITLSYGAFALATGLGHFLIIRSLRFHSLPSADDSWVLHLYRCLQIGVFLLAVGVILGGIWANYSWGRFWDWDPKETWALIALLSYVILLHGRLGGWWGGYGLAVGSIASFLTILMAWYGVNFVLGKGLHSYGFGNGGQIYVGAFALLELIVLTFALARRPKSS